MDARSADERDCVAGGLVPIAIRCTGVLNLEKATAIATGAIDGYRDGRAGKPFDGAATTDTR
jgi:hypothetical protein